MDSTRWTARDGRHAMEGTRCWHARGVCAGERGESLATKRGYTVLVSMYVNYILHF